jgi:tRNA dimethylallyltransferase
MQWHKAERPLVVIVGPTAVGKTEIAIQLAERMNGEIVSADSRLFYRGMDIGTAKPSRRDRSRVPHHLIDVADPDESWSLAVFQQAAKEIIFDIHRREKLPFLVGGTGQYIKAVVEEYEIPKQMPDLRMRDILEAWGNKIGALELHRRLQFVDPEAAGRIEPNNLRRTVRALEVMLHTGRRFSEQRNRGISPYLTCTIGLTRPRVELYSRIDARIDQMISDGLMGEVQGLLMKGIKENSPPFSAIGYREMIQVIHQEINLSEAAVLMKRYTRQYVRRQSNWFKENDPSIHWFDLSKVGIEEIYIFLNSQSVWIH